MMSRPTLFILAAATVLYAQLTIGDVVNDEQQLERKWNEFKKNHKKQYKDKDEEDFRRDIFSKNLDRIDEHNLKAAKGEESYIMDTNEFSDLSDDEHRKNLLGRLQSPASDADSDRPTPSDRRRRHTLPAQFDWVSAGIVTPVKDQDACGACYSFATTAAIESHYAKKYNGTLLDLSMQQIVDCSKPFGNLGCNGGLETNVYRYLSKNSTGIQSLTSYPYLAATGSCSFTSSNVVVKLAAYPGHKRYSGNVTEAWLMQLLYDVGPINVALYVTSNLFYYKTGVFSDSTCRNTINDINHAVLLVGYGTDENGLDYWMIKNSWGPTWGENGFFRINRANNMCGVMTDICYPLIK